MQLRIVGALAESVDDAYRLHRPTFRHIALNYPRSSQVVDIMAISREFPAVEGSSLGVSVIT